jgi:hypothetical protein
VNQIESVELLGITERIFCWAFASGQTARLGSGSAGLEQGLIRNEPPVTAGKISNGVSHARSRFHTKHFHEHLVNDHQFTRLPGLRRCCMPPSVVRTGSWHEWVVGLDAMDLIVTEGNACSTG